MLMYCSSHTIHYSCCCSGSPDATTHGTGTLLVIRLQFHVREGHGSNLCRVLLMLRSDLRQIARRRHSREVYQERQGRFFQRLGRAEALPKLLLCRQAIHFTCRQLLLGGKGRFDDARDLSNV
jgi:hypothetical protein